MLMRSPEFIAIMDVFSIKVLVILGNVVARHGEQIYLHIINLLNETARLCSLVSMTCLANNM
jgi:hypothetical protein